MLIVVVRKKITLTSRGRGRWKSLNMNFLSFTKPNLINLLITPLSKLPTFYFLFVLPPSAINVNFTGIFRYFSLYFNTDVITNINVLVYVCIEKGNCGEKIKKQNRI